MMRWTEMIAGLAVFAALLGVAHPVLGGDMTFEGFKAAYAAAKKPVNSSVVNGDMEKTRFFSKDELANAEKAGWTVSEKMADGFSCATYWKGKELSLVEDRALAHSGKCFLHGSLVNFNAGRVQRGEILRLTAYMRGAGKIGASARTYGGAKGGYMGNISLSGVELNSTTEWEKVTLWGVLPGDFRPELKSVGIAVTLFASTPIDIDDIECQVFDNKTRLAAAVADMKTQMTKFAAAFEIDAVQQEMLDFLLAEQAKVGAEVEACPEASCVMSSSCSFSPSTDFEALVALNNKVYALKAGLDRIKSSLFDK